MQNGSSCLLCNGCCAADNITNNILMVKCPRRQRRARRARIEWKPRVSRQTWAARYETWAGKCKNIALTIPFAVSDDASSPNNPILMFLIFIFSPTLPFP